MESYFLRKDCVMVNFMCQFYKAIMVSIYLVKHYFGCVFEGLWSEINIRIGRLVKQIALTNVGGHHPIS